MKRFLSVSFLLGLIVVGIFGLNLFLFVTTPSGEVGQTMTIERGSSLNRIANDLQERGVISNIVLFKVYLFLKQAGPKVRAGDYNFEPHLRPPQVVDQLMKGDFARRRVTILEGWTVRDVANSLAQQGLVTIDTFIMKTKDPLFIQSLGLSVSTLEGYLYPDTYEIYQPKGDSSEKEVELIQKFVGKFKEVYKNFEARAQERSLSQHEIVTLASIIEKETGNREESALVASVFLNRLKKGIPLASDPTIIYGIPNFNGNLTHKDLATPGPYNTYLNGGLPPTPISNPGEASIRAVLTPAETRYLYFVSKNDGTHQFSETEAEHNQAVRKYQSLRRQSSETLPTAPGPTAPRTP